MWWLQASPIASAWCWRSLTSFPAELSVLGCFVFPPSSSTWWLHFPSKIGKPEFQSSLLVSCYILFLGNLIYTLGFLNVIPWPSSRHVHDKYRHRKYSTYEKYMSLKPYILPNDVQVLSVWYISGYLCNTIPRNKPCQFKLHEDPSTKDKNNLHLKVLAGTVFDPFWQNREPRSQLPIEKWNLMFAKYLV